MRISDWSSDVCSSDLIGRLAHDRKSGASRIAICGSHRTPRGQRLVHRRAEADRAYDRDQEHRRGNSRRSEEHTSELQSLMRISYAVFCLKKKKKKKKQNSQNTPQNTMYRHYG